MRWVVTFNGARDRYQVPLALEEVNRLHSLVTDWYSPIDTAWFSGLSRMLPRRARTMFARRYRQGLPSKHVRSLFGTALRDVIKRGRNSDMDVRLGRQAGRIAREHGVGMLAYSYYAYHAFQALGVDRGPRLIFQVHPHPASLRTLFEEELERVPEAHENLRGEAGLTLAPGRYDEMCAEPLMADGCIASSGYTRRTLVAAGVRPDRITVIPYGVDLDWFRPAAPSPDPGRFRVLFVGQMVQRKGLSYLLEAWRRLALPSAELILAGHGTTDWTLLDGYRDQFTLRRAVDREELRRLYQTADVFCMPSLAEGFGLVYLEALACGTPVIGTPNTAVADLVTPGVEGFVHEIRDVEGLMSTLEWLYEHPEARAEMRAPARRLAERHSWQTFRRAVADVAIGMERRDAGHGLDLAVEPSLG